MSGFYMVAEPAALPLLPSPIFLSLLHKAVPCASFCLFFLGVHRDVENSAHSGPTPGKGETSLELAHDQF